MDELIKQLTTRVGLSPDQARQAADTVLGFVKTRLPGPIASQIDGVIGGKSGGGGFGDIAKDLGGMLGR